jgi:hypothetical protein
MKDKKDENKYHCVQCGGTLDYQVNEEKIDHILLVCHRSECPNYGLLQIGIEGMPKEEDND